MSVIRMTVHFLATKRSALLIAWFGGFVLSPVSAEIIKVEGVVKSFDSSRRVVKLTLESGTLELEVSRKAEVTANGKSLRLDDVSAGQKVTVRYYDDLEIVVGIEIEGGVPSSTETEVELLEVSELSPDGNPWYPWLSKDGLTIYWNEQGTNGQWIWTAVREDVDSLFTDKKRLFKGRHPTVSADGLEMVLQIGDVLHRTTRQSVDESFDRPRVIRDLRDQPSVKMPSLSPDGLKLYFNRKGLATETEFAVCSRRSPSSSWERPNVLQVQHSSIRKPLRSLYMCEDELRLFCVIEGGPLPNGNLMMWTRETLTDSFSSFEYIRLPYPDPMYGRSPRFVEATGELFFTVGKGREKWGISMLKNFGSTLK